MWNKNIQKGKKSLHRWHECDNLGTGKVMWWAGREEAQTPVKTPQLCVSLNYSYTLRLCVGPVPGKTPKLLQVFPALNSELGERSRFILSLIATFPEGTLYAMPRTLCYHLLIDFWSPHWIFNNLSPAHHFHLNPTITAVKSPHLEPGALWPTYKCHTKQWVAEGTNSIVSPEHMALSGFRAGRSEHSLF